MTVTQPADYSWLATLLELLIERYDDTAARQLLRDASVRRLALDAFAPELIAAGAARAVLASAEAENLLTAVAALRVKFSPDEARMKVRLNIAMRQRH